MELLARRRPAELGIARVAWFNTERPHEHLDDLTLEAIEDFTTLTDTPYRR